MALALVDFEALCGFVEHEELVGALEANPELREVIGEAMASLLASSGDSEQLRYFVCFALGIGCAVNLLRCRLPP